MRQSHSEKWARYNRMVLDAVDIAEMYSMLGVSIPNPNAISSSGWLPVRAMGRNDANPSAAINVGPGPGRGRYKDFGGTEETFGLFDFAAKYSPVWADWKQARDEIARIAGVFVHRPRSEEDAPVDVFRQPFEVPIEFVADLYCQSRPPISYESIVRTGGRQSMYSAKLPQPMQQLVLVWPFWGPLLEEASPIGYHCARADGTKIRVYRKNVPDPEELKTLSKGNIGYLNCWAARHHRQAHTIWLVEGLSDMLTLQTMIGFTELGDAVLTMGGASARILSGSSGIFAGKRVNIVYDPDEAGDIGAIANAAKISAICDCRIVNLPTRGQDLRDWVLAGGTLDALRMLANGSLRVMPDSSEVSQALEVSGTELLRSLEADPLGPDNDGNLLLWNRQTRRITSFPHRKLDRLGYYALSEAFASEKFFEHVADAEVNASDSQVTMKSVKESIARVANMPVINLSEKRGQGIWEIRHNKLLLINGDQADIWDMTSGTFSPYELPAIDGKIIEYGLPENRWYQRETIRSCISHAFNPEWRSMSMQLLVGAFDEISNLKRATDAQVMAGCCAAAMFGATWPIRPMVAIDGATNSGKSQMILRLLKPFFGELSSLTSAPTEAGLRRQCNGSARPHLVDEFDTCANPTKILETLRSATRGQRIVHGAVGQNSSQATAEYLMSQMFFIAGADLESLIEKQIDRNRYIFVSLKPSEGFQIPTFPQHEQLEQIRHRVLATMLIGYREIKDSLEAIGSVPFPDGRIPQIYAVPIAALAFANQWTLEEARDFLLVAAGGAKKDLEQVIAESSIQTQILEAILCHMVRFPRGRNVSVLTLLTSSRPITDTDGTPYSGDYLIPYGIRLFLRRETDEECLFVHHATVKKRFVFDAKTSKMHIARGLLGIRGAFETSQRLGNHVCRGIGIPLDAVHYQLRSSQSEREEQHPSSGFDVDDEWTFQ